eukprot:s644_g11.t1
MSGHIADHLVDCHAEIENCISQLRGQRGVGERAWILPLHGSMSVQQQGRVFKRPPAGQRKIIVQEHTDGCMYSELSMSL